MTRVWTRSGLAVRVFPVGISLNSRYFYGHFTSCSTSTYRRCTVDTQSIYFSRLQSTWHAGDRFLATKGNALMLCDDYFTLEQTDIPRMFGTTTERLF